MVCVVRDTTWYCCVLQGSGQYMYTQAQMDELKLQYEAQLIEKDQQVIH